GDLVKAYYVASDHPKQRAAGILTVIFDRALGLGVLVLMAGAAVIANYEFVEKEVLLTSLALTVWGVIAGMIVATYLFYSDRVRSSRAVQALLSKLPLREHLSRLSQVIYQYKEHPGVIARSVFVSVAIHSSVVFAHACVLSALGVSSLSVAMLFLLVPLSQIAMAIPLTPGSLGTAEVAYSQLFQLGGAKNGSETCLLFRVVMYVWALIGCVVYLTSRGRYRGAAEAAKAGEGEDLRDPEPALEDGAEITEPGEEAESAQGAESSSGSSASKSAAGEEDATNSVVGSTRGK
ncbi:MAG: lysylphosphatidylglycerol synthase transmembrane domain-containing protein, partial [Planctomycetota bacterium]